MFALSRKIISLAELHEKKYRGLKKVRIVELLKTTATEHISLDLNRRKLDERIQQNDVLLYKLTSQDLWVKITLKYLLESVP